MSHLREIQLLFQNALCKQDDTIEKYLKKPSNMTTNDRMKVYQNDYFFRLRDALKDDYMALYKMLDHNVFEDLIREYLKENPSETFTIREVGYSFPNFLEKYSMESAIIEMAYFESEMLKSLSARDTDLLDMNTLAAIDPSEWEHLQLQLHPSVRSLQCKYNTVDLWLALNHDEKLNSVCLEKSTIAVIWRYKNEVYFRNLTPEEAALFYAIHKGNIFSDICEGMLNYFDDKTVIESVSGILQTWIHDGMFSK